MKAIILINNNKNLKENVQHSVYEIEKIKEIDKVYFLCNDSTFNIATILSQDIKSINPIIVSKLNIKELINTEKINEEILIISSNIYFIFNIYKFYKYFENVKNTLCVIKWYDEDTKEYKNILKHPIIDFYPNGEVCYIKNNPNEENLKFNCRKINCALYDMCIINKNDISYINEFVTQNKNFIVSEFLEYIYKKEKVKVYCAANGTIYKN